MGSSGPQALPSSPGAGQRAPSPQEQSGTRAHGLGTVCFLPGVSVLLVLLGGCLGLHPLWLSDSDKAPMPYSMHRGTTALYSGLMCFLAFFSIPLQAF